MAIAAAPIAAGPIAASPVLAPASFYFGDTSEVYIAHWTSLFVADFFGNSSVVYEPKWKPAIYADYFGGTAEVFLAVWFENDKVYGAAVCVPPVPGVPCRDDCREAV